MTNELLQFKIKQRLNKQDSKDYENLDCFKIAESFNTFQNIWVRDQIRKGESEKQVVEDIQILLKDKPLKGINRNLYFETELIPEDSMSISTVHISAIKDECPEDSIRVTLIEDGNYDSFLREYITSPSYEWRETFYTMHGNKLRIYTNNDFKVTGCSIDYYRFPISISIEGCQDEFGNGVLNVPCEFKNDVIEILIKGTCSIIAGDIENFNQLQRNLVQ